MMKKFLNSKGFTLIEIMVGVGISSIVGLGLMNIAKIRSVDQERAKTSAGTTQVMSELLAHLSSEQACTNTFENLPVGQVVEGAFNPATGAVTSSRAITIIDANGNDVLAPGDLVEDSAATDARKLIINSYFFTSVTRQDIPAVLPAVPTTEAISFFLNVVVDRPNENRGQQGAALTRRIVKRFPFPIRLEYELAGPNDFVKCFGPVADAVEASDRLSCISMGGVFSPGAPNDCNLTNYSNPLVLPIVPVGFNAGNLLTSKQFLDERLIDLRTTYDPAVMLGLPRWVPLISPGTLVGTIMQGPLVMAAGTSFTNNAPLGSIPLLAGNAVPADFFTTQRLGKIAECGVGEVGVMLDKNRGIKCSNITCNPGQYFAGINKDGTADCYPLAINSVSTCGPGAGGHLEVDPGGAIKYICDPCTPATGAQCNTLRAAQCPSQTVKDSCENVCGAGTLVPAQTCADLRATYCVSEPTKIDACGVNCGVGTKPTCGGALPSAYAWCGTEQTCERSGGGYTLCSAPDALGPNPMAPNEYYGDACMDTGLNTKVASSNCTTNLPAINPALAIWYQPACPGTGPPALNRYTCTSGAWATGGLLCGSASPLCPTLPSQNEGYSICCNGAPEGGCLGGAASPLQITVSDDRINPVSGVMSGTIDIRFGEPGETITLSIATTAFGGWPGFLNFGPRIIVGPLKGTVTRVATTVLDATGGMTTSYSIDNLLLGTMSAVITMTKRSSPKTESIPSSATIMADTFGGAGGAPTISCFVAGTKILMDDGLERSIEDARVGDLVENVKGESGRIAAVMKHEYSGKIYSVNGSGYFFTPNHPFLTTDGWKSLDPKTSMKESGVQVSMLKVGDVLVKKDGFEGVDRLEFIETSQYVYNIEVSGHHEYIADGYAVHNKSACNLPNAGTCGGFGGSDGICSTINNPLPGTYSGKWMCKSAGTPGWGCSCNY